MLASPKIGERVQIWYAKSYAATMPHHAKVGHVVARSKGPGPRNHGVYLDGRMIVVPCGNLRRVRWEAER